MLLTDALPRGQGLCEECVFLSNNWNLSKTSDTSLVDNSTSKSSEEHPKNSRNNRNQNIRQTT